MSGAVKPQSDEPATIEQLLCIPEPHRRHELIDGEIVDKGAATGEHGATQADLVTALNRRFGPDARQGRRRGGVDGSHVDPGFRPLPGARSRAWMAQVVVGIAGVGVVASLGR